MWFFMFSSIFFSFGGSHSSKWVFSSDEAPSHHHPAHHEGVVIRWCSSPEDLSMIFKLTTNFGWTDAMWQSYRFFKGKSSWFADLVVRPKFLRPNNSTWVVRVNIRVTPIKSPVKGLHLKRKWSFYQSWTKNRKDTASFCNYDWHPFAYSPL